MGCVACGRELSYTKDVFKKKRGGGKEGGVSHWGQPCDRRQALPAEASWSTSTGGSHRQAPSSAAHRPPVIIGGDGGHGGDGGEGGELEGMEGWWGLRGGGSEGPPFQQKKNPNENFYIAAYQMRHQGGTIQRFICFMTILLLTSWLARRARGSWECVSVQRPG